MLDIHITADTVSDLNGGDSDCQFFNIGIIGRSTSQASSTQRVTSPLDQHFSFLLTTGTDYLAVEIWHWKADAFTSCGTNTLLEGDESYAIFAIVAASGSYNPYPSNTPTPIVQQNDNSFYTSRYKQSFKLPAMAVTSLAVTVFESIPYPSSQSLYLYNSAGTLMREQSFAIHYTSSKRVLTMTMSPPLFLASGSYYWAMDSGTLPVYGTLYDSYADGCAFTGDYPPNCTSSPHYDNYFQVFGYLSGNIPPILPEQQDFGIIGNAIRDVMAWLFVPDNLALNQFTGLWDTIKMKPPIGYFTASKTAFDSLHIASGSFALVMSGVGGVTDPLKTGLTWILWLMLAFWILHRIRQLEI